MVDLSRCLWREMETVSLVDVKNHSRMLPVGCDRGLLSSDIHAWTVFLVITG